MVSAINSGRTWFDEYESYPLSIDNGHRLWSDEEAIKIKQEYANGATITDLSRKHKCAKETISNLVSGKSYTNLPVIERTADWVMVSKARFFTDDEVRKYRKLAETQSMLSIYNEYNIQCNYAAFRNMIRKITYKNVD